jgi:hypothetical protein
MEGGVSGGTAGVPSQGGSSALPADCPVPAPIGVPDQTVAIQSINFATSEIVLRNVSDTDQTVLGGRVGWQWCDWPMYWDLTESADNVVLAPGKTFSFIALYNTSGPVQLFAEGGEMAIYTTTGSFNDAEFMVSFVAWGEIDAKRESFAVTKDLWTFSERIETQPDAAGFVATGLTKRSASYRSVRAACLRAPPNE